jgi:hypothetical protein
MASGGAAIGASYGLFILETREYASSGARHGKRGLVTLLNNIANLSALLAFGLMVPIAALESGAGGSAFASLLALIGGLPIVALPLLLRVAVPRDAPTTV